VLIEPRDVDKLDDTTLKRLVLAIHEHDVDEGDPLGVFWTSLAIALVRVVKDRRRAWLLLEAELLNDPDEEGELVGLAPDDVRRERP
jgi:hypothetical protein